MAERDDGWGSVEAALRMGAAPDLRTNAAGTISVSLAGVPIAKIRPPRLNGGRHYYFLRRSVHPRLRAGAHASSLSGARTGSLRSSAYLSTMLDSVLVTLCRCVFGDFAMLKAAHDNSRPPGYQAYLELCPSWTSEPALREALGWRGST